MESALAEATLVPFVGRWRRLVSTTNWEKGRIIHDWRLAAIATGAAPSEFSDEAWSRAVGAVSAGHVGRLRRVFERFGESFATYDGLFWSHVLAALDWDDAEMWLEGALQSGWTVSVMRDQRWHVLGGRPDKAPPVDDHADAELDEDAEPEDGSNSPQLDRVRPVEPFDDDEHPERAGSEGVVGDEPDDDEPEDSASSASRSNRAVRPLAELPSLPPDVCEAFEAFKLCILRHKLSQWQDVSRDDVLASLDALKELALAPSE
jgi:hypothetical protein